MTERICLGLDVAKLWFEACLLVPDAKPLKAKFPNNAGGFQQLSGWLHGFADRKLHACLEPTGIYSTALANFLWNNGIAVSQVNSYAVLNYGKAKNFRSKTDRIDAYLLADYCLTPNPPQWTPPAPTQAKLKELQHRLATVDEQVRAEENRLEVAEFDVVREDIEESLGRLYVRRNRLEKELKAIALSDQALSSNFAIINSIIGLGEKSALRLLAFVQFEKFDDSRKVSSFAGLTPREFESGTSIHKRPRISRVGNAELRAALYFPAMSAIKNNPQMREFADRLKAKNKPPKVVICAVMRKLLVLASTLIRKQQLYDALYRSPLATIT